MCACTVHVHVLYTLNVSHTMDCDTRQRHCDMGHGERGSYVFAYSIDAPKALPKRRKSEEQVQDHDQDASRKSTYMHMHITCMSYMCMRMHMCMCMYG